MDDVAKSLQRLARRSLVERESLVVAITGSVGKTTTKDFLAALLAAEFKVGKPERSYNSQLTLPLTVLHQRGDEEILVLEMGVSKPGEMDSLVQIAPPDIALITTIGLQHTSHFQGGLEAIAEEKGKIFSHPKTRLGLLSRDSPCFDKLVRVGSFPKRTFSLQGEGDYSLKRISDREVVFSCEKTGPTLLDFALTLPAHDHNFLAALALSIECGLSIEAIRAVSPTLKLPRMRYEVVEKGGYTFINDAYNASPDSMRAALEGLSRFHVEGKKIAVLSEMDDLGEFSMSAHESLAECSFASVDCAFFIGKRTEGLEEYWKKRGKLGKHFAKKSELALALKEILKKGDLVLLKGARAHALEEILEYF